MMRLQRWANLWADTLFKRLFVLMWVALVVSHLCAFFAVRYWHGMPDDVPAMGAPGPRGPLALPPVVPSLPPGGFNRPPDRPGEFPPGPPDAFGEPGMPPPDEAFGDFGLPARALWLDYAVRMLVIGLAAWAGARWLASPMRKLTRASAALGRAIAQRQPAPPLDEHQGTLEVRQTAKVFNAMATQLHAQFDSQSLLMAAISHDLRTPLARMRLRLERMDESDTNVARCVGDLQEMDALIGNVLEMMRERHASEVRERIDARALILSIADDLAEQGQPVSVVEHAAGALGSTDQGAAPIVMARSSALRRVVGNLIGNAVRHGGSARVSMALQDGSFVLTIDDDGPGIAPYQLDAVFQPFFRADASRSGATPGSGLGLYIARDLIEREGGSVTLANRAAGGLRATVSLPLV